MADRLPELAAEARRALGVRRRAALERKHRGEMAAHAFAQLVVHEQHRRFRDVLAALGMRVHGDLKIGLSARDAGARQPWLLPGYRLGAPPSRTNPEGQPWGEPLFGLDDSYNQPGTVSDAGWSPRLSPSWRADHRARLRRHRALNLPLAFALAPRARSDLQTALGVEAARLAPLPPGWPGATHG